MSRGKRSRKKQEVVPSQPSNDLLPGIEAAAADVEEQQQQEEVMIQKQASASSEAPSAFHPLRPLPPRKAPPHNDLWRKGSVKGNDKEDDFLDSGPRESTQAKTGRLLKRPGQMDDEDDVQVPRSPVPKKKKQRRPHSSQANDDSGDDHGAVIPHPHGSKKTPRRKELPVKSQSWDFSEEEEDGFEDLEEGFGARHPYSKAKASKAHDDSDPEYIEDEEEIDFSPRAKPKRRVDPRTLTPPRNAFTRSGKARSMQMMYPDQAPVVEPSTPTPGYKKRSRDAIANDQTNVAIKDLRQINGYSFKAIAEILNQQLVAKGEEPNLSEASVYSRFKRNASIVAAFNGETSFKVDDYLGLRAIPRKTTHGPSHQIFDNYVRDPRTPSPRTPRNPGSGGFGRDQSYHSGDTELNPEYEYTGQSVINSRADRMIELDHLEQVGLLKAHHEATDPFFYIAERMWERYRIRLTPAVWKQQFDRYYPLGH